MALRNLLLACVLGVVSITGCAGDDEAASDDSFATASKDDREIARVGGGSAFALADDGAYLVFDNGLFRVGKDEKKERVADAPDRAGELVVTDRFVVLAADPPSGATLTFYDRTKGFEATTVKLDANVVEIVAVKDDQVLVSFLDDGLVLFSSKGKGKTAFAPGKDRTVRQLATAKGGAIVHGVVDRANAEQELIEVDLGSGKGREVFAIPPGSFLYVYDEKNDAYFTERSHRDLPKQSVVSIIDGKGRGIATLETPLNTLFATPAVDDDGFYLAARLGASPGTGSWKLLQFDKKTLAMSDRGRVEPQVYEMVLRGGDLYYAHFKDAARPLRVRPK